LDELEFRKYVVLQPEKKDLYESFKEDWHTKFSFI
jgi:hypothetical protein